MKKTTTTKESKQTIQSEIREKLLIIFGRQEIILLSIGTVLVLLRCSSLEV